MTTCAIVANSTLSSHARSRIQSHDMIIAVDGGLRHLAQLQLTPDRIIGDMDSVDLHLLARYSSTIIDKYPLDKNESDTELAISFALKKHFEKITLFAALGGRADHALYNYHLLIRHQGILEIDSGDETLFAISGDYRSAGHADQLVSLLPLGDAAEGVTTQGLKWELQDKRIDAHFMSLSNLCVGEGFSVSIKKGSLILVMSHSF